MFLTSFDILYLISLIMLSEDKIVTTHAKIICSLPSSKVITLIHATILISVSPFALCCCRLSQLLIMTQVEDLALFSMKFSYFFNCFDDEMLYLKIPSFLINLAQRYNFPSRIYRGIRKV